MTAISNLYLADSQEEMNLINRLIDQGRLRAGIILGLMEAHHYFFDPEVATEYRRNWNEFGVITVQNGFRATRMFPQVLTMVDDYLAKQNAQDAILNSPYFKTPLVFSLGHFYLAPMMMLHEFIHRNKPERLFLGTRSGFIYQTVEALADVCGIPLERLNVEDHCLSD